MKEDEENFEGLFVVDDEKNAQLIERLRREHAEMLKEAYAEDRDLGDEDDSDEEE